MILIYKLDLKILKMYLHIKNKLFYVKVFKSYSITNTQTDVTDAIFTAGNTQFRMSNDMERQLHNSIFIFD